jgi:hypothetical protein
MKTLRGNMAERDDPAVHHPAIWYGSRALVLAPRPLVRE